MYSVIASIVAQTDVFWSCATTEHSVIAPAVAQTVVLFVIFSSTEHAFSNCLKGDPKLKVGGSCPLQLNLCLKLDADSN